MRALVLATVMLTACSTSWREGAVATKPPYHVSFRGGIWTVRCLLADGRTATIKISREEGRVLSTQYRRNSSNQALQPTADRGENLHMTTSTFKSTAGLVFVSGG